MGRPEDTLATFVCTPVTGQEGHFDSRAGHPRMPARVADHFQTPAAGGGNDDA